MCVDFKAEYEGLQHALRYMYEQRSVAFVDSGIAQLVTILMLANMLQAQGLAQGTFPSSANGASSLPPASAIERTLHRVGGCLAFTL